VHGATYRKREERCVLRVARWARRSPSSGSDDWPNLDWNELYLLQAFLSYNNVFQIMFFNCLVWREYPEIVSRYFPECTKDLPGGIGLRRVT
jgi:hypothetical protein